MKVAHLVTSFAADDHRNFNRSGAAFDVGETFAGVDYDTGVDAAVEFAGLVRELVGEQVSPAAAALRWILDQPGVTTVIPGARTPDQARSNAEAAALPALSAEAVAAIRSLYDRAIRPQVHHRW